MSLLLSRARNSVCVPWRPCSGARSRFTNICRSTMTFSCASRARCGDCQFVFLRHFGAPKVTEIDPRAARSGLRGGGSASRRLLRFLNRLSQSKFVAAAGLCDVFLDSIGWSGCNSALESLPHDLPIVTMRGMLMRGRHSAAILEMMGVRRHDRRHDRRLRCDRRAAGKRPPARAALSRRMADNKHKVYRDRACVSALEDFLDRAARRPAGSLAVAARTFRISIIRQNLPVQGRKDLVRLRIRTGKVV